MRKSVFLLSVFIATILTACGSGSATNETKDSTASSVDTLVVQPVDSTGGPAVGGGGSGEDLPVRPKENVK